MCGRFSLKANPDELREAFPGFEFPADLAPRYNIAPAQPVAVIANTGQNKVEFFQWGLIPAWAQDARLGRSKTLAGAAPTPPIARLSKAETRAWEPAPLPKLDLLRLGSKMINARAETLADKPAFRAAYKRRRCLVLADGFYEWRQEPGSQPKTPMYIRLKSGRPFAFAGLWETWRPAQAAPILSCAIITTRPNSLIQPIHDRMPVILPPEHYALWLDPAEQPAGQLSKLLAPYPAEHMTALKVSRLVNDPKNDLPECLIPAN